MKILFDVGNTHTTVALTENGKFFKIKRISTYSIQTEDELYAYLKVFFGETYDEVIVSSVVPNINHVFEFFSKKYAGKSAIFLNAQSYKGITWNVKIPSEIGADRVANIIAAERDYGKDAIVVDFGTAITIDILKEKSYEGGIIIPGFSMMINALFKGTAKLPKVELKPFNGFIGKDTESNIRIGIINTVVEGIGSVINKIKNENFRDVPVIFTGGQSKIIMDYKRDVIYDLELGLRGIYYFYESVVS
ncbi:pantothenate kinase [Thermosipho melanesiensis]|uniref:Type III pantothenate kinase n=2 Tax=Thermosipho melanesiensis TaxID=46541 RepID=COAX_THEM4|nr:type III pantothenate kinase [Thermosipho melanesiensis]A6LMR3.1 RecName: Full=Type III pantothenate kinase; AltName: Full=PanK-III; AltName: Full=Pantothenic acid kinase [Thermosipho melanesiensis BI429]ABR31214.1 putative transcriptional acitvator, Baf family [Thermosipho melanesiensis BI429]APT74298.1 pantothenate kinase [Thermosipho melanesiensis]OOC36239.1 pantothenate kinase [Thermosipho melanesiensis]OOC37057.1 pantothenate kinase [Thermosipho melanesiensis]OOC37809.1 pantothenate k